MIRRKDPNCESLSFARISIMKPWNNLLHFSTWHSAGGWDKLLDSPLILHWLIWLMIEAIRNSETLDVSAFTTPSLKRKLVRSVCAKLTNAMHDISPSTKALRRTRVIPSFCQLSSQETCWYITELNYLLSKPQSVGKRQQRSYYAPAVKSLSARSIYLTKPSA